jgi:spermidine synthase
MVPYKALMIRLFLFLLGLTAMATQVIMIRETLAIFHGNELIIGLFMGIWMMLTAAGSFLAVQSSKFKVQRLNHPLTSKIAQSSNRPIVQSSNRPIAQFLVLALFPLTTLFLLVLLRFTFIPAGIMPGLGQTTAVIFLSLLPFCLVSGALFPILVKQLSSLKQKNLLHEGYALESAGSILGGLLFSMLFIFALPPYESLVLLTLICLVAFIIIAWIGRRKILALSILTFSILFIILNSKFEPARLLDKMQFSKQEVVEIKSSPYGMIAVTRMGDQLFLYENGIQVSPGDDPIYREESVHYAMLMHPGPEKVLLLSGGASGIIDEILKYPVTEVVYSDTDPWLIKVARRYRPLPDDYRVNFIFKDPRIFLNQHDEKYDVILINTSEPNSAVLNRFYTVEFFKLLKERLNPGGIISLSLPAAGNYMNETSRQVHSVSYNSLQTVFSHVRIIPGGKDYFLASGSSLDHSIFQNYDDKRFTNIYVNPNYVNENLLRMRSELIMKDILLKTQINSDLKPYVFSLFLKQWLERYKINSWLIPLILLLVLVLSLISLGPLNLGLFAGGFTASSLEFLLLIWFQVMYGYVYQMTGVIFAVFMAGLVIGSLVLGNGYWELGNRYWVLGIGIRKHSFKGFLTIQGIFAFYSLVITALLVIIPSGSHDLFTISLILILVFITGLLMGTQFSSNAHLRTSSVLKSSGESFSADLFGSAIGIMLVSVYIVPQFGLPVTALMLAGLNLVALVVAAVKGRRSLVGSR